MSSSAKRVKRKRSLYSHPPLTIPVVPPGNTNDKDTKVSISGRKDSNSNSRKRNMTLSHSSDGKNRVKDSCGNSSVSPHPIRVNRVSSPATSSLSPHAAVPPPVPTTSATGTATPLSVLFGASNVSNAQVARSQFKEQKVSEYLKEKQDSDEANLAGTQSLTFKLKRKKNQTQIVSSKSVNCFHEQGVVVLEGSSDAPLLPPALLQELQTAAVRVKEKLCSRLQELEIPFETTMMQLGASTSGGSESGNSNSSNSSQTPGFIARAEKLQQVQDSLERETRGCFRFREVSSRCLGRLDVSLLGSLGAHPFDSPALTQHTGIECMVRTFLGDDCVLSYVGLVLSFPGSSNQPFHEDGTPLFFQEPSPPSSASSSSSYAHSAVQCPSHAINVFLPLQDITEAQGPTEFLPGE